MGIFWYIKQNNKLPSSFCEAHSGCKRENVVLQSVIRGAPPSLHQESGTNNHYNKKHENRNQNMLQADPGHRQRKSP